MVSLQRAKAIGIATRDRSREELIEVLKEARKATFPITDVANIRIDALAQEWFLQTFQQCREDTFHGKIPQLNASEPSCSSPLSGEVHCYCCLQKS